MTTRHEDFYCSIVTGSICVASRLACGVERCPKPPHRGHWRKNGWLKQMGEISRSLRKHIFFGKVGACYSLAALSRLPAGRLQPSSPFLG
jgi:hypothetical protein